ncbi:MAG: argininosuccinate synthase [Candidatus Bathyarchaeota archaeon]|nr:argininosuccinate synthase [Candidatus Bathyarchaeum sp.]
MKTKILELTLILTLIVSVIPFTVYPVMASNATSSVRIVKYAADNTIISETTKTYEWLRDNLPQQGDGVTHYYHQGPIFEGDMWDPTETQNLKDKGAVMGTALKDLCELVGGMSPGNEIMLSAVDGWHTEFAYENIYEPLDEQGVIALCWYNGEDALFGERYGDGYTGNYYTAMQIVFLAGTTNVNGEYVFGNSDMAVCLPDEKYQHFYEGLPSTNGLSGKWICEVSIFSGEAPVTPGEKLTDGTSEDSSELPVIPIVIGVVGVLIIATSVIVIFRRK